MKDKTENPNQCGPSPNNLLAVFRDIAVRVESFDKRLSAVEELGRRAKDPVAPDIVEAASRLFDETVPYTATDQFLLSRYSGGFNGPFPIWVNGQRHDITTRDFTVPIYDDDLYKSRTLLVNDSIAHGFPVWKLNERGVSKPC